MELTGNSFAQRMVRLALARSGRSAGATTRAPAPSAFDRAIEHFAHGRWSEAFAELVPLADAGHCEAARIAMLMTTRGPRLFGRSFPASPSQRERWHVLARRADAAEPGRE
jgi:hypothetical protein